MRSDSNTANPFSIIRTNKFAINGSDTVKRKKVNKIVIGKPSDKRFICGAAFDSNPIDTCTKKSVPITGIAIIIAFKKRLLRFVIKNEVSNSCFSRNIKQLID